MQAKGPICANATVDRDRRGQAAHRMYRQITHSTWVRFYGGPGGRTMWRCRCDDVDVMVDDVDVKVDNVDVTVDDSNVTVDDGDVTHDPAPMTGRPRP